MCRTSGARGCALAGDQIIPFHHPGLYYRSICTTGRPNLHLPLNDLVVCQLLWALGFKFWGLIFAVEGLGFRFWGLRFAVEVLGFRVWGLGFMVQGLGVGV